MEKATSTGLPWCAAHLNIVINNAWIQNFLFTPINKDAD